MVFKIDFIDGKTITWHKKGGNTVEKNEVEDYYPRFYLEAQSKDLRDIRTWVSRQPESVATKFEYWKPTLSQDKKKVLRIDTRKPSDIKQLRTKIKKHRKRTKYRFHNAGFSPQFQFCIQTETNPVPEYRLSKLEFSISRKNQAQKQLDQLKINQKPISAQNNLQALEKVKQRVRVQDPDILVVDNASTISLLREEAQKHNLDLEMGRETGFEKLAGGNTVNCYGKTVRKNSRYNIPGRVLIDRSNSFLLKETSIRGLWGLVERSYRPLQELAWSSIGRTLTSIEVKKAYLEQETLTPWKNYNYEKPKKASTLHKADTGGFIFNPEPSLHRDVYQADFASLFPNIMIKKNISPETVCCQCCDNSRVPELNYSVCEKQRGFISEVLDPLVSDRQDMKEQMKSLDQDSQRYQKLKGRSDAIKWLLVSCFGYMGHAHASYGAIECHQAIQAYDREIMIKAKEIFEENGYKVVHGIIDSLWLQKNQQNPTNFQEVCEEVTEEIGIELEPEEKYEWCGFVPRRSSSADIATLNRYFGKKQEGFEKAGIETEQSSTPRYIKKIQNQMIKAFDQDGIKGVLEKAKESIREIENQNINTEELLVEKTVSKSLENYQVENRSTAAIKRAEKHGIKVQPGQKIRFVVTNDQSSFNEERVKLPFEKINMFDEDFYKDQLIKATQTILSPKNQLDKEEVRRKLLEKRKNQRLNVHK